MVEHDLHDKVIGISCDGTGWGPDGASWGCELMLADRAGFVRMGHLRYFHLPGGDIAARQTFRPALAVLYQAFGPDAIDLPIARTLCPDDQVRRTIGQMIDRKINCPATSSLGRLFDAVAAMTGLADTNHYEGQAPMLLESHAPGDTDECYDYDFARVSDMLIIDPSPMIKQIVHDIRAGRQIAVIADRFHNTIAEFLADGAGNIAERVRVDRVVLTGGCFANCYLSGRLKDKLERIGMTCYEHETIPCNDGGISLGQAAIAVETFLQPVS